MKITKEMTRAAYLASKNVFSGLMSRQEAIDHLSTEFGLARGSSGDFITNFRHMVHGRKYTRTLNNYSTDYFLKKIREDFELTIYQNALQAGYLHVEYYASIPKGGNLRGIQKILDIHSEKIKSLSQDIYISDSGGYGYQNTIIRTGINIDLPDAPENKKKTKTINGQIIYPRNPSYAKKSLSDANFLCEISSDHKTFTHKSSKVNFTEAHHLR